jgi:flagellar basal body-associated protein FliL
MHQQKSSDPETKPKKPQPDLTAAINDILRQKEGFGGVDDVYFSNLSIP